ncbi:MAG: 2-oxoglutarate and iron-dependent oxygenase domain-containing protein, partial [Woeseiaceae bacterium]|nr:2-oxoglutarate and iron-dependent oxygenase domain-containing protein [Woeseiaceae bacterium]
MHGHIDLDKKPSASDDRVARSVPVIDLDSASAVERIALACRDWGFFQVTNHGVPEALIEQTWQQARAFFALPVADKERIIRTRENPWGYYNNELTKNQRDKKEVFDYTSAGTDPVYGAENRWPDFDDHFRAVLEEYRDACVTLSLRILRMMAEGLGLEKEFFSALFEPDHTGFVRLNYYPVADPMANRDDVDHLDVADMGV